MSSSSSRSSSPHSRPSSAPPSLSMSPSQSPLTMSLSLASGVRDIRADEHYPKFYETHRHLTELPKPFDAEFYRSRRRSSLTERRFVDNMFHSDSSSEELEDEEEVEPEEIKDLETPAFPSTMTTPAIPIRPIAPRGGVTPIWNTVEMEDAKPKGRGRLRNKSLGKIAINADSNLSTSTDDLLSLAGGAAQWQLKVADSPPASPHLSTSKESRMRVRTFAPPKPPVTISAPPVLPVSQPAVPQPRFPSPPTSPLPPPLATFAAAQGLPPNPTPDQLSALMHQLTLMFPQHPAPPPQSGPSSNVCKFYAGGFCSRGAQCTFLHVDAPQAAPMPPLRPTAPFSNVDLAVCRGRIAAMCLDQHGCRYLQRELDEDDPKKRDLIYSEVVVHVGSLMRDPFGNYLCQKLLEKCSPQQRLEVVRASAGELVTVAKNMHGTRAVQRLVELLEGSEEIRLVRNALTGHVVGLIQDLNGNHVIQKCLQRLSPADKQFIYDAVASECVAVATHRHGCCVFQRCIDHASHAQQVQLVAKVSECALPLVQDAFGNYAVQYVLDLGLPHLPAELMLRLKDNLYYLARQKFSSNVVEKCLKVGGSDAAVRIMRELLFEDPDPRHAPTPRPGKAQAQTQLFGLLQDAFGNYVVQTCLSEGANKAPREYSEMAALLRPVVHQLSRNVPYMKRIQSLLSLPVAPTPPRANGHRTRRESQDRNQTRMRDGRPQRRDDEGGPGRGRHETERSDIRSPQSNQRTPKSRTGSGRRQ